MYDLVIIGGSAAGTAAAIYAARRKLNFIMISEDFGGEVARSGEVWNYPGFPETNGIELSDQFFAHLKANDVKPEIGVWVESITKQEDGTFEIRAKKGNDELTHQAKAVIITTGVHPRRLEVPGEEEFEGKGVTWCTTCDGPLFKGKKVVTIGGGNSALESALMLAGIAEHVTLVNKNAQFKGEQVLIDKVEATENVDIIYNAKTSAITGEMVVNGIEYTDEDGATQTVDAQGVFIHIGLVPNSGLVGDDVEKNKFGEIIVNQRAETSIEGLYAAGDVTDVAFKQIAIAVGQGTMAALSAIEYLNKREG